MIRRLLAGAGLAAVFAAAMRVASRQAARRLLDAPRVAPSEAHLGPAIDALGGEVVRLRSRDGVRLAARWLPAEPSARRDAGRGEPGPWDPDPHEAILLLHGYTGSIAPDLVEYGPFLRQTAGVLGLDFRGHGDSDDGPSTFGLLEIEDVAGALAWLGERGIRAVALVGSSMGGITALAAVAVLGDGTLTAADVDPAAPRHPEPAPRPRIVAVVADSVAPDVVTAVASRLSAGPARRFLAERLFDGASRVLGGDPRATEPARVIGLVEPVPLLLIHGEDDTTVPIAEGRRLAALSGPSAEHWVVPGADHGEAHAVAGQDYERRVTDFLRVALRRGRGEDVGGSGASPIIDRPGSPVGGPTTRATQAED